MATDDVPGANPANRDALHVGCWAEHEDGSLILVEGYEPENNRVVFEVFDLAKMVGYRHAMSEDEFKKRFSFDAKKKGSIKWTWHDKTDFPWDRVMARFHPGESKPFASDLITAAERVRQDLKLRGIKLTESRIASASKAVYDRGTTTVGIIADKLKRAFHELRS